MRRFKMCLRQLTETNPKFKQLMESYSWKESEFDLYFIIFKECKLFATQSNRLAEYMITYSILIEVQKIYINGNNS